ncbi:PAS domain-containing sensor histidine kinase [Saccharicrinis sp. GN24d3]|uniref:PAS domain-containing sensor histidine kinase n=1 Tax=Saccharicrinis sp. GN24d3 TaxID=3458416 RepID=UPI0040361227
MKKKLTEIIKQISKGESVDLSLHNLKSDLEKIADRDEKDLYYSIIDLAHKNNESRNFITELSKGNFETQAPENNPYIALFKQLQTNLNHLMWQIQRISEGDLHQDFSYLGDTSFYFNKLIFTLQERKLVERALKESEQKFKTIIETSPDGIAITDLDGKVEFVTAKIVSMWGYDYEDEIIGRNALEFVDPSFHDKSVFFISEVIKGNLTGAAEYLMVRKDGSKFYSEVNTNVLRDGNDTPVGVLYIERDVTQRKEIEELISDQIDQLSQLNATKDKFFRIIAHDLKNPFNSLLGLSKILSDSVKNGNLDQIQQYANSITEAATHTFKLLENLLDWSRLRSNKLNTNPHRFRPSEAINAIISQADQQAKAKGIQLLSKIECDLEIWADQDMLKTVLRNLVSNALKFTGEGGTVQITTQCIKHGIQFGISDNGVGIRKEYLDKLFRIDSKLSETGTARERGTGLGLILCKEFVEKNNGKIWVESELGKGSEFKFTVPVK